jgi:uncharacterized protein with gpF-like domain
MKITPKKQGWARNREVTLRGQPLNVNASVQNKYAAELRKLVLQMTRETKQAIVELFRSQTVKDSAMDASIASQARILMNSLTDKFTELFNYKSSKLAKKMVQNSQRYSITTLNRSLKQLTGGLSLNTSIITPEVADVSKAIVAENVSLIKSIPSEYFKDVTGLVMRSISGAGLFDLQPEIAKYEGMTERRAKLIALDQTRKAYNLISKSKMEALGVTHFEFLHTGGSQSPRDSHLKMDGHIFSFANLISEQRAMNIPEKDLGYPGIPPNCRCRALPVIDLSGD